MQSLRSRLLYQFFKLSGSPFDKSSSLEQQRAMIERQNKVFTVPRKVSVQPVSIGEMHAEWLRPAEAQEGCAILYLHGGGYTMGSCNTHRALAARIALAAQTPTLLIDYRLAPEHPFPAALDDAQAAYRWLEAQGMAASKMVVAGDSSGGGLSMALALRLRDEGVGMPAGLVCLSPWADLTMSGESVASCAQTDPLISLETSKLHAGRYAGEQDPASPLISPVFAELHDLPPMLIQTGEHEILRSDATRLAENAQKAGVAVRLEVWEGMWHDWQMFAGWMPEAQGAIDRIGDFIRERLKT